MLNDSGENISKPREIPSVLRESPGNCFKIGYEHFRISKELLIRFCQEKKKLVGFDHRRKKNHPPKKS